MYTLLVVALASAPKRKGPVHLDFVPTDEDFARQAQQREQNHQKLLVMQSMLEKFTDRRIPSLDEETQQRQLRAGVEPDGRVSFASLDAQERDHMGTLHALERFEEPRKHSDWSLMENRGQTHSDAEEDELTGGDEKVGGAPNDHWRECAQSEIDGKSPSIASCECSAGEVRFGSKTQGIWTMPIKMGKHESVQCSLEGVQKLRVNLAAQQGGGGSRQCQCIERDVRISAVVESFLQTRDAGDDPEPVAEASKVCLDVPVQPETPALVQTEHVIDDERRTERRGDNLPDDGQLANLEHYTVRELATEVKLNKCQDDTDQQVWTYLMSSGQIRHINSGKCLGVYFNHKDGQGEPLLKANDCNANAESQYLVQRWIAKHYTTGTSSGAGKIELGYGSHADGPLCLVATSLSHLAVKPCSDATTQWTFSSDNGKHEWKKCSPDPEEGGMCNCAGEIRMGDGRAWSSPVPIPNVYDQIEETKCDLGKLREIAIEDPVAVPDLVDPYRRDCQCRGKRAPDGSLAKIDEKVGAPIHLMAGGVVALLIVGGIVLVQQRRKAALLDAEYEEEYEEEFEEEEYEEE